MSGEFDDGGWEERGLGTLFGSLRPANTNQGPKDVKAIEHTPTPDDIQAIGHTPILNNELTTGEQAMDVIDEELTTSEQTMDVIDMELSADEESGISRLMNIAKLDGEIEIVPDDPELRIKRIKGYIAAVLTETEDEQDNTKSDDDKNTHPDIFSNDWNVILGPKFTEELSVKAKGKKRDAPVRRSWLRLKFSGLLGSDKK